MRRGLDLGSWVIRRPSGMGMNLLGEKACGEEGLVEVGGVKCGGHQSDLDGLPNKRGLMWTEMWK